MCEYNGLYTNDHNQAKLTHNQRNVAVVRPSQIKPHILCAEAWPALASINQARYTESDMNMKRYGIMYY